MDLLPKNTAVGLPVLAVTVSLMEEAGDKIKTLFSLFQARAINHVLCLFKEMKNVHACYR